MYYKIALIFIMISVPRVLLHGQEANEGRKGLIEIGYAPQLIYLPHQNAQQFKNVGGGIYADASLQVRGRISALAGFAYQQYRPAKESTLYSSGGNRYALYVGIQFDQKIGNGELTFKMPLGYFWVSYFDPENGLIFESDYVSDAGLYLAAQMSYRYPINKSIYMAPYTRLSTLKSLAIGLSFGFYIK